MLWHPALRRHGFQDGARQQLPPRATDRSDSGAGRPAPFQAQVVRLPEGCSGSVVGSGYRSPARAAAAAARRNPIFGFDVELGLERMATRPAGEVSHEPSPDRRPHHVRPLRPGDRQALLGAHGYLVRAAFGRTTGRFGRRWCRRIERRHRLPQDHGNGRAAPDGFCPLSAACAGPRQTILQRCDCGRAAAQLQFAAQACARDARPGSIRSGRPRPRQGRPAQREQGWCPTKRTQRSSGSSTR